MTVHPETRFQCDRCGVSTTLPVQNIPVHARAAGPEGWLALVVGTDPSTPPSHLCGSCHATFNQFLHAKKGTGSQ